MMRKKNFPLITLFFLSVILRFWKLGEIPMGLSLSEIEFGLSLSRFFGPWVLDPFVVRLPFCLIGIFSTLLLFIAMQKTTGNFRLSYFASLILAFLPWHIQQSRIYSLGSFFVLIILIVAYFFSKQLKQSSVGWGKLGVFLAIAIFLISLLSIPQNLRVEVDQKRNLIAKTSAFSAARFFSNKFIESYRYRQKLIFENLDFGNFFFAGHPRQRWGVEETPKFYISLLPFIIIGLIKVKKKLVWILVGFGALAVSLLSFLKFRGPGETLVLVIPIVILASIGVSYLVRSKTSVAKVIMLFTGALLVFEFLVFSKSYFGNLTESSFSPRRPIYEELVSLLKPNMDAGENVLVTERLKNPANYFRFYLKGETFENLEFRDFNIWEETSLDKIFVDILPFEPSPSEFLYTETGDWPEEIEILHEMSDAGLRYKVVVYRM